MDFQYFLYKNELVGTEDHLRCINKDQYINYLGYTIKIRHRDTEQQFKSVKGVLISVSEKGFIINVLDEECFIQFQEIV